MKHILFFSLAILFISCSKDSNDSQKGTSTGYISYTLNGNTSKFEGSYKTVTESQNGAYMQKFIFTTPSHYTLYRLVGLHGQNNAVGLDIVVDSLVVQSYTIPQAVNYFAGLVINGKQYTTYHPVRSSSIVVNIASHANGRVNGTYSGKLFLLDINQLTPTDSIFITGEIKDVEAIY